MYGHSLRAICAVDEPPLQLKCVDGGNGYLSQTDYVVQFTSTWCPSAYIEVATIAGMKRFGPYAPGIYTIKGDLDSPTPAAQAVVNRRPGAGTIAHDGCH